MFNPFNMANICHIFKKIEGDENRILTRESTKIEIKRNLNISNMDKYSKTMASFANFRGDYIIFGISDSPRTLDGIDNNKFEQADESTITSFMNTHFSPSILLEKEIVKIDGAEFGLIYTYESELKPVICIKNKQKTLKDTDIYYRYAGRSESIKYPELRHILDLEKNKEKKSWMDLIRSIIEIGPDKVTLLNLD